jgi:hypothetical protein
MEIEAGNIKTWGINLYLLNLALLITHEIDSAYWKEWNLFGLPGDIQGFLVINFLLIIAALVGFRKVIFRSRGGHYCALTVAGIGIFAFFIHTYFFITGHKEFTLPASIVTLIIILFVSLFQGSLA